MTDTWAGLPGTVPVVQPLDGAVVLWHCGYWDGPLSGVCLVGGRLHWFETDDDPLDDERTYLVYELTDAEARVEVERHFRFEQHVGLHTCNHASLTGERPIGKLRPRDQWAAFYDTDKVTPPLVIEGRTAIGRLP